MNEEDEYDESLLISKALKDNFELFAIFGFFLATSHYLLFSKETTSSPNQILADVGGHMGEISGFVSFLIALLVLSVSIIEIANSMKMVQLDIDGTFDRSLGVVFFTLIAFLIMAFTTHLFNFEGPLYGFIAVILLAFSGYPHLDSNIEFPGPNLVSLVHLCLFLVGVILFFNRIMGGSYLVSRSWDVILISFSFVSILWVSVIGIISTVGQIILKE